MHSVFLLSFSRNNTHNANGGEARMRCEAALNSNKSLCAIFTCFLGSTCNDLRRRRRCRGATATGKRAHKYVYVRERARAYLFRYMCINMRRVFWLSVRLEYTYAHAYLEAFRLPVNKGESSARNRISVFTLSASPAKRAYVCAWVSACVCAWWTWYTV